MPNQVEGVGAKLNVQQVAIANGQTVSGAIDVNGQIITGIDLGATLTGTTLGIQNCVDGTNYRTAYDNSGNVISWTVAGGRHLRFDPPLLGYSSIKLVSGSAEGAARTLFVASSP